MKKILKKYYYIFYLESGMWGFGLEASMELRISLWNKVKLFSNLSLPNLLPNLLPPSIHSNIILSVTCSAINLLNENFFLLEKSKYED